MTTLVIKNFRFYFYALIFFQISIFFLIFGPYELFNLDLNVYKDSGDGPSYLNFSFKSAQSILGDHRTFGLPLFLKVYQFFDKDLLHWPKFNYLFYIFSINFFLYSLLRAGFNSLFSFIGCFSLLISYNFYGYFSYWTEILSIIFCILSLSFFFLILSEHKNNLFKYILFTFLIFFMYQVRPSFIVFIIFPILYSIISNQFLNTKYNLISFLSMCFVPLIIFLILRLLLVGNFGLVSFNGGPASNAIILLERTDIKNLKYENQLFAKKIIEKRKKIPFPCNLEKESERAIYISEDLYGQKTCWNKYFMLVWMEAILEHKGITPFSKDDPRNIDAWNHTKTLGVFFSQAGNNVGPDKILLNFAMDVYSENKLYIFKRILKSPYHFLRFYRDFYTNQFLLFYLVIFFLIIFYKNNPKEKLTKNIIDKELIMTFTGFIIWILNMLLFYGHQNGELRALQVQNFFLVPLFFSYFTYLLIVKKNYINRGN
jgi:hypothetical protein